MGQTAAEAGQMPHFFAPETGSNARSWRASTKRGAKNLKLKANHNIDPIDRSWTPDFAAVVIKVNCMGKITAFQQGIIATQ